MVKFILDISFVERYVEKFYSEDNCSEILDKALPSFLEDNPMLVVSIDVIEQSRARYPKRILVLDTLFGLCGKENVRGEDRADTLIKLCAICEVKDKETHVIAEDTFIIDSINKTTHQAKNIEEAKKILGID